MSLVDKRIEEYKHAKELKDNKILNYIPFKDVFPEFSKSLPGLLPGTMYKLLSYTSIGKSTITRFITVLHSYHMYLKYGVKFKVIYFALEESKEDFIDSFILFMLFQQYGIISTKYDLNGYNDGTLTDDLLLKIESVKQEVENILKYVDIQDNITHATGMYKYCLQESHNLGVHYMKNKKTGDKIEYMKYDVLPSNVKSNFSYDSYVKNDPDLIVIVVCDQINNISAEKSEGIMMSQIDSMKRWSMNYCRLTMTKHWKWVIWNVQQLAFAGEGLESKKHNDLKPSLDKGGGSKEINGLLTGLNGKYPEVDNSVPMTLEIREC
jgi:hypothetical protein